MCMGCAWDVIVLYGRRAYDNSVIIPCGSSLSPGHTPLLLQGALDGRAPLCVHTNTAALIIKYVLTKYVFNDIMLYAREVEKDATKAQGDGT